ncbi:MAG: dicarboxylate/amino acid:cation symporter [Acidobacteria bacterium CG_4_9_14_3_um_filter_49_7]|nr:MAG: dicarboxylate/amino acid:cation symporter [Acidobacteria bacterium CG_4_9_14_3_um_filter_49_7]
MEKKPRVPVYIQILAGAILGVICGLILPEYSPFGGFLGTLFLRLLKMLIIPLIFSSIVMGVVSTSSASSFGRLGLKTLVYYISTSLLAILTGQLFVNLLQPGVGTHLHAAAQVKSTTTFSLKDIFLNMVPDNIFSAMASGDVLPIIFFALLAGFFIGVLGQKQRQTLTDLMDAIYQLMMKITGFVILLAPVGIFGLIYKTVASTGTAVFGNLMFYFFTVLAGLVVHFFVTLPLLLHLFTRQNPYRFMKQMIAPLVTAFSTSSSSATLPLTIETIETEAGVSNRVAGFVLPLGATINMDGTALYECAAVIFIAQAYGYHLSMGAQVVVVVTALLVSIGAAGIPMAGLVMMTVILNAVHLPLEGVGLIIAVDRFLDMFRTATNVLSDSTGAKIIDYSEQKLLSRQGASPQGEIATPTP